MPFPASICLEKITIVTSFRPRHALLLETSSIINVRNKSGLPELHCKRSSYRLHLLSKEVGLEAEGFDMVHRKAITATEEGSGNCRTEVVDLAQL